MALNSAQNPNEKMIHGMSIENENHGQIENENGLVNPFNNNQNGNESYNYNQNENENNNSNRQRDNYVNNNDNSIRSRNLEDLTSF